MDGARADLLPPRVRDALELLAAHATDEWLCRHGPQEPERRKFVRGSILASVEGHIARAMFRPALKGLDMAINLTGSPEPRPRLAEAPDADSTVRRSGWRHPQRAALSARRGTAATPAPSARRGIGERLA